MKARVAIKHQRVPIYGLPREIDGLRIAHVSDLHFRRWNPVYVQTQQLLTKLQYDLLAVTGDFSTRPNRWREVAECCRRFFEPIRPPLGIYAVLGNHDDRRLGHITDLPFTWLHNESTVLHDGRGRLCLAGVRQDFSGNGRLERALAQAGEDQPVILLAHFPSTIYDLPVGRVQLQLSGHTHGGQIRFPFLGALWANDRLSRQMARGMHLVGKTWLHVSPGTGVSSPLRFRILCPPEVSILELCKVGWDTRRLDLPDAQANVPTYASDKAPPRREPQEALSGAT